MTWNVNSLGPLEAQLGFINKAHKSQDNNIILLDPRLPEIQETTFANMWKKNDILNAYSLSHTKGLKTEIDSKSILYWSKIIFEIARDGLKKRNFINKKGNDETVYLKNVENILINGRTKAEDTLKNYK